MKTIISGINGRMGSYVYDLLKDNTDFNVVGGLGLNTNNSTKIYKELKEIEGNIDLVIDFSVDYFALSTIEYALNNGIKVISGTTGFSNKEIKYLKDLSIKNKVTLFLIPNFAKGASTLYKIIDLIKNDYDFIDILETHSIKKLDKPSGTSKEYADRLGIDHSSIQSLRVNDVIANHDIVLRSKGEKITLSHAIETREAFDIGFKSCLNKILGRDYLTIVGLDEFYKM